MAAWGCWAEGYAVFFLQCVRAWARERAAAGPEAAAQAAADAWPCARLLLDCYFMNHLREVDALSPLANMVDSCATAGRKRHCILIPKEMW